MTQGFKWFSLLSKLTTYKDHNRFKIHIPLPSKGHQWKQIKTVRSTEHTHIHLPTEKRMHGPFLWTGRNSKDAVLQWTICEAQKSTEHYDRSPWSHEIIHSKLSSLEHPSVPLIHTHHEALPVQIGCLLSLASIWYLKCQGYFLIPNT